MTGHYIQALQSGVLTNASNVTVVTPQGTQVTITEPALKCIADFGGKWTGWLCDIGSSIDKTVAKTGFDVGVSLLVLAILAFGIWLVVRLLNR